MSTPGTASQAPRTSFDLMRAFKVLFDDPDWVKKLLMGSLFTALSMLLVGIFFVAGYSVRLVRNAANGDAQPLPDWDDLGGLFQEGLAPVGVYIIYAFGAMLVPGALGCVVALIGGGLGAMGSGSEDLAGAGVAIGMLLVYAVVFVMSLLLMLFLPAALTRMILEKRFGAAFEFGAVIGYIKRNTGSYLMALLACIIASTVSQFGILLFCIGILPAVFWSYTVMAWSVGEAARLDPGRG